MPSLLALVKNFGTAKNSVTRVTNVTPAPMLDSRCYAPKNASVTAVTESEAVTLVTEAKNASVTKNTNHIRLVTPVTLVTLEIGDSEKIVPDGEDYQQALAELDRFFAVAVPDGEGGWIDPAYKDKQQQDNEGGRS